MKKKATVHAYLKKLEKKGYIRKGYEKSRAIEIIEDDTPNITPKNSYIVVALIDDEAAVKRFYKEKNFVCLQPENPFIDPIITNSVSILGIVKGILGKL